MRTFNVGFNDYFHTASIHLDEVHAGFYYLSDFVMWICDHVPSIPFPKSISCNTPEGQMSMREWYGDLQQWFHITVCMSVFDFVNRHTKSIVVPLPYHYLEELFPDEYESEIEWDEDDRQFRQLTRELSRDVDKKFRKLQDQMDYKYVEKKCNRRQHKKEI